ncbi:MAG: hypothetical protein J6R30_07965 [Bacteroidales bacterium]|nr:hypothetical protein [Bacteroidales bacterium]
MITISNNTLTISLHTPDSVNGYYRGTRFDHAGVFESIICHGCNYCEPWFESYSPLMHDAVCGPAEEFSPIGLEGTKAGDPFLKIGVGILERLDNEPYDRFRLHRILDEGERLTETGNNYVRFTHRIASEIGYGYDYVKEIAITSDCGFTIRHSLRNTGRKTLEGDVYNHNFFTLGLLQTSPSRTIDFPFHPEGDWRAEYSEVGFTVSGIRFSRVLQKGESVFTGNLHQSGRGLTGSPNAFILSEEQTGRRVQMHCKIPMTKTVFWSNHRIACIEPYIDFKIKPGESLDFDIDYSLR